MTLDEFKAGCVARNPRQINRTTDCVDWFAPDGEKIIHNRTYFSRRPPRGARNVSGMVRLMALLEEPKESYWCNIVYADYALAKNEARQFKGAVEECHYCDQENPTWFMSFDDLDLALTFCFYYWNLKQTTSPTQPALSLDREGRREQSLFLTTQPTNQK